MNNLQNMANELDLAAMKAEPMEQLSKEHQFDIDNAYEIQALSLSKRYERGEKLVGLKMGFTSVAKMEQMGVHDMIWGRLTNKMAIANEGFLNISDFIHPRAEPEICVRVSKDINRELNESELHEYFDGVSAAIEIIDSRYQNFKFSLEDVIADNCSSSGFVIGSWFDIKTPISKLKIELSVDDEIVQSGNSNAILGDPWKAILASTRLAEKYGQMIKKGSIILAGAATAAVYIKKGQRISAHVDTLGKIGFNVV